MEKKRCAACRKLFHPCPQLRGQKYCSAAECQRERKRRWQVAKRAGDPDYRDNDAQANRNWRTRHPDYWRAYRRTHPQSVLRNRRKQIADRDGVPPYMVFGDASLAEMAAMLPTSEAGLLEVNGVGQTKLERYGSDFIDEIKKILLTKFA